MKIILTDCDGVLLNWDDSFFEWLKQKQNNKDLIFDISKYNLEERYGIPYSNIIHSLCIEFNNSAVIGFLPPLRDSVKYVKKIYKETGYKFLVISSLGECKFSQKLRTKNLIETFGKDVFYDFIYLPNGASKSEILKQWKDSESWWIEDKIENVIEGLNNNLNCILMNHPYNISREIPDKIFRVNNWKEIYNLIV